VLFTDLLKLAKELTSETLYNSARVIFNDLNNKELALKYLIASEVSIESPWDYIFIAKIYHQMGDIKNAIKFSELGLSTCDDTDEKESLKNEINDFMPQ
jgi:hypothetical protein